MSIFNNGSYALPTTKTETKVKPVIQIHNLDNYQEPPAETTGVFFNPPVGDTRVRFLSQTFAMGLQTWNAENKPIRFMQFPEDLDPTLERPKGFKAFKIWNYQTGSIMIWVITQKTILDAIEGYSKPGSIAITGLDLIITKTGSGKTGTKYKVTPGNPAPFTAQIQRLNQQTTVNWMGLFDSSKLLSTVELPVQPKVTVPEEEGYAF